MTTIIEALSAVAGDVGAVGKERRNAQQGFTFRGIDDVMNAVSGPMRKHGVIVLPKLIEKERAESRTAKGAIMANVYVTVEYVFYGPEGDSVSATVCAESFDSGDKATAKAMSVAFRTALLQSLCLPTDEPDPDLATYERHPAPQDDRLPRLWHAMRAHGLTERDKALTWLSERLGVEITDSSQVTPDDADVLLALLDAEATA